VFDNELAEHPHARSSKSSPHCEFEPPDARFAEEETGDVRTREEQEDAGTAEQQQERPSGRSDLLVL
jgi:hypothetical protein